MKEGLVENNPVILTNDPANGLTSRDRVLNDAELAAVWRACTDDDFGRIVKLLILTGCRRDEIGGLGWSELDLDTDTMTLPRSPAASRSVPWLDQRSPSPPMTWRSTRESESSCATGSTTL
jgi:integrase